MHFNTIYYILFKFNENTTKAKKLVIKKLIFNILFLIIK